MSEKIKVIVVDDSTFMRKALIRMLGSDPMIEISGQAESGEKAIKMIKELKPNVVTLDVKMPGMDGLQTLEVIMRECPVPVLMVSSVTSEGGDTTLRALEIGAVDFIDKSSCHTMMDILDIADTLVKKVKVVAGVDLSKITFAESPKVVAKKYIAPVQPDSDSIPSFLVAIGSSTGGPMALERILTKIPEDFSGAIIIVQHMPLGFTRSLAERYDQICEIGVSEAQEDDLILSGRAYIAPSGYHLTLRKGVNRVRVRLSKSPKHYPHCPSVDVMMESVAKSWSGKAMGIILTGMGNDGSAGIVKMHESGAATIAQNEESCVIFGMPGAAQKTGVIDKMVPLNRISKEILLMELTVNKGGEFKELKM